MLKDYADEFYLTDFKVQEILDLYSDTEEFMHQFPVFRSYSIARRYIKVVPNVYYGVECQNVVMLFDGLYYVVPYLAKQKFLAFYQVKSKKNKE